MKTFDLTFSYKGARQYIHGTDMLNKCIDLLQQQIPGEFSHVSFAIHRMTDSNTSLQLYSSAQACELSDREVAVLKFDAAGKSWEARLTETENRPTCRYPYDEDAVLTRCELDQSNRSIVLRDEAPYTAIETLVAMTKILHHTTYPNLTNKWVFCRWESLSWPFAGSLNGVCIQLVQALGTRLTKSSVRRNGKVLGQIFFSARVGNDRYR